MIAMISPGLSSCEHSLNTLRYADSVKELGAEDPALQKASPTDNDLLLDDESMRLDDGVLSPEDSDLAQLRSLNDTELSADWYNFQEAVSHLQALEEDLVDSHRSLIVSTQQWTNDAAELLATTNEVDYDQDTYCNQLEELINEKIEAFISLREKARNFRDSQLDEEAKSQLLNRRH
jgi:kinesin family protein 2/24